MSGVAEERTRGTAQRLRRLRARDGYERWARRTDPLLLVLALLFVGVLVLPLAVDLRSPYDALVRVANVLIWAAFALDYVVRLCLARDRRHYVRTHVVDLLVVLVPLLRPLRAFALLRAVPLGSAAVLAHQKATHSLHARVTGYVLSAVVVALLVGGVAVSEAERRAPGATIDSVGDGIWWATVTVTTVGYGDEHPVTLAGRAVAVVLMLVGIGLLGVVTGAIATWFVDRLQEEDRAEELAVERAEDQRAAAADERVEATLDDVLSELRALRVRLDALESGPSTLQGQ